jgi:FkbM family methyltransferase
VEKADSFGVLAYAQDGEDMILRRMFEGQSQGFYVDVGAHHPFRFSNTCYFHRHGWHGINIDANPAAIDEFRRYRPSDINVCVGISDASGTLAFHRFNESALDTFDAALAAERAKLPGYRLVEKSEVAVRRLGEVLVEHLPAGQSIDFLSVDVEGLDLQVLKSNDWSRFRPRVLLVEARGADLGHLASEPCSVFARSVGYRPVAKTVNTVIFAVGDMA